MRVPTPLFGNVDDQRGIVIATLAMVAIVTLSNVAVQYPINDWLTYGALTYPVSFLVTDLTNRLYGPGKARRIVYCGFALAVVLSLTLATPRIALASGSAFLIAQLLDIGVFDRLRHQPRWWTAPLASSLVASGIDTAIFFSVAFAGTALPWTTWLLGDYAVKAAVGIIMLLPFRLMLGLTRGLGVEAGRP